MKWGMIGLAALVAAAASGCAEMADGLGSVLTDAAGAQLDGAWALQIDCVIGSNPSPQKIPAILRLKYIFGQVTGRFSFPDAVPPELAMVGTFDPATAALKIDPGPSEYMQMRCGDTKACEGKPVTFEPVFWLPKLAFDGHKGDRDHIGGAVTIVSQAQKPIGDPIRSCSTFTGQRFEPVAPAPT